MFGTGKLHNILVNNGLTDDQYKIIRNEVVKSNRMSMDLACIIIMFCTTLMTILSLCELVSWPWLLFFICDVVAAICMLINKLIWNKNPSLLKYIIYLLTLDMVVMGILLGTIFDLQRNTAPFIAILILMPLLFTDRCYRECFAIFLVMASFLTMAVIFNEPETLLRDFLNVGIFGTVSMMVTYYLAKMKVDSFYREYLINTQATHDTLTNMRNRTSYEEDLNNFPSLITKSLTCIYTDLNGLHVVNNTKGHDAGDEMIKCVSSIIKEEVNGQYIYRTGGDEFVSFMVDISIEEVNKIVERIRERVIKAEYALSIGVYQMSSNELDMQTLIRESEQLMYQDKKKYYLDNNLEMRR